MELKELIDRIFTGGFVSTTDGKWTGYVGFRGKDALSLQVMGNFRLELGVSVFPDLGSCPRPVFEEVHEAIMDSGLVKEWHESFLFRRLYIYYLKH